MDHRCARDIDLALLGVLPAGQLLGGSVAVGPVAGVWERPADPNPPSVRLRVSPEVAASARSAGGLTLRDEELTPLAVLDVGDTTDCGSTLAGTLRRLRERESGPGRRWAVEADDLWPDAPRTVVVLGRPPTCRDEETLRRTLSAGSGSIARPEWSVLALVSDDPDSDVPPPVLLDVARLWLDELGLDSSQVKTAPIAWRDPQSNAALADRFGSALGGSPTVFLDPDDGSQATRDWHAHRAALEAGTGSRTLEGVSSEIAERLQRWRPPRHRRGLVLMFSGLSGSGKSTVARDVSEWITTRTDRTVSLLDGDVVRTMLSSGLGFSKTDRELNVRRIGYVGAQVARHGGIAICAPIAPYAATREAVRTMAQAAGDFVLVHVSTSLEECERRDLKGLYAKARAGLIPEFTGISDPYEEPQNADLTIDTGVVDRGTALTQVVHFLESGGWLRDPTYLASTRSREN